MIHAQRESLADLIERLPGGDGQGSGHLRGACVESGAQAIQSGLEMNGVERLGMRDERFLGHVEAPGRVKGVSSPARRRRAAAKEGAGASARAAPAGTIAASSAAMIWTSAPRA